MKNTQKIFILIPVFDGLMSKLKMWFVFIHYVGRIRMD